MRLGKYDLRRLIATRYAPIMFVLALVFLICQAVLVVVWFDVPNFSSSAEESGVVVRTVDDRIPDTAVALILMIWPLVIAEAIFHWVTRPWDPQTRKYHFLGFLFCICPSLRMCARYPVMNGRLWLPGIGWRQVNKRLRARLERQFSVPMIFIALMILPVLLIEFFMKTQVSQYAWLWAALHISTGIIWFAFAAEFILMFLVAERKISYCMAHWIDLAIILLPFISFLRSLRGLRSLRSLRAAQVTKMARVYRLRGTAVKALRALILLEIFARITGTDIERRIEKLQKQLDEVEAEAKQLRRKIAKLERTRREEESASSELAVSELAVSESEGSELASSELAVSFEPEDSRESRTG